MHFPRDSFVCILVCPSSVHCVDDSAPKGDCHAVVKLLFRHHFLTDNDNCVPCVISVLTVRKMYSTLFIDVIFATWLTAAYYWLFYELTVTGNKIHG